MPLIAVFVSDITYGTSQILSTEYLVIKTTNGENRDKELSIPSPFYFPVYPHSLTSDRPLHIDKKTDYLTPLCVPTVNAPSLKNHCLLILLYADHHRQYHQETRQFPDIFTQSHSKPSDRQSPIYSRTYSTTTALIFRLPQ